MPFSPMNQTTLERTRITAAGAEISISPRTTQYNKTEKKSINFVDIDKVKITITRGATEPTPQDKKSRTAHFIFRRGAEPWHPKEL